MKKEQPDHTTLNCAQTISYGSSTIYIEQESGEKTPQASGQKYSTGQDSQNYH